MSEVDRERSSGGFDSIVKGDPAPAVMMDVHITRNHRGTAGIHDFNVIGATIRWETQPEGGLRCLSHMGDHAVLDEESTVGGYSTDGPVVELGRMDEKCSVHCCSIVVRFC